MIPNIIFTSSFFFWFTQTLKREQVHLLYKIVASYNECTFLRFSIYYGYISITTKFLIFFLVQNVEIYNYSIYYMEASKIILY